MIYADKLEEVLAEANGATIVAASKTQTVETLRQFHAQFPDIPLGENRAQEFRDKYDPAMIWHFIGRLQPNKAKYVVGKAELIHSLDGVPLASELDRLAKKLGIVQRCLVEVNIAGEESKGGVSESELFEFLERLRAFENICVEGLTCVMPNAGEDVLRPLYARLKALFDKVKSFDGNIKYLSAGMTSDWRIALEYGSNMLRLGRLIFGERQT